MSRIDRLLSDVCNPARDARAATRRCRLRTFHDGGRFSPDLNVSVTSDEFVLVDPDENWGTSTEIRVILNWFEELKRLVPIRVDGWVI